jgi:hypothetical protein
VHVAAFTLNKKEHILIVNYDFPPNDGIGGRRWAKFAKQLANEGYEVHVIKANSIEGKSNSAWTKDVIHERIHVYSLPRNYPQIFSHPKADIISKIQYRFYKYKLLLTEKGTIYDISIGWEKALLEKAQELISTHHIRQVMASGAPWKMLFDVSKIKEKNPAINLIIDYRDPWLNALNYGMPALSASRRKAEEEKQTFVLNQADYVITPYAYLTAELKYWSEKNCNGKAKFEVLSHFYDPDDLVETSTASNDQLTLVYGGDLYQGLDKQLLHFRDALSRLEKTNSVLYRKLDIRVYTNKTDNTLFRNTSCVRVMPSIGKEIFNETSKAHGILIFLSDNKKNDRTTKFFENLPARKPFIVVAEAGEVTNFVRDNKLGFVFNDQQNDLEKILVDIDQKTFEFNDIFGHSVYSLENVTRQLISFFK